MPTCEGGYRRHDAHGSGGQATVEGEEPDRAEHGGKRRPGDLVPWDPRSTGGDCDPESGEAERLRRRQHRQGGQRSRLETAEEVTEPPGEAGAERQ
jgi:hypothetical protein